MKNIKNFIICVVVFIIMCLSGFVMSGCTQADNVQYTISKEADAFNTYRKVTFINLRTNEVLLEVQGLIAIKDSTTDEIAIIIEIAPDEYQMHYLYVGGEVVYLVQQVENTNTDPYHWEINVRALIPNIDLDLTE